MIESHPAMKLKKQEPASPQGWAPGVLILNARKRE